LYGSACGVLALLAWETIASGCSAFGVGAVEAVVFALKFLMRVRCHPIQYRCNHHCAVPPMPKPESPQVRVATPSFGARSQFLLLAHLDTRRRGICSRWLTAAIANRFHFAPRFRAGATQLVQTGQLGRGFRLARSRSQSVKIEAT